MTIRRCPQCHTACDDQYGFCIKCGCEFPKIDTANNMCPLCGYQNPQEADYCVKCGTPLVFKNQFENNDSNPKTIILNQNDFNISTPRTSRILIVLGYIFSFLGGLIGLIIAIYLATRKDPVAKKHGRIQLGIFVFYLILLIIFIKTGAISIDTLNQITSGNMTNLTNMTSL